jgi:putative membrane-bound dehydrogenase-like protein
MKRLALASLMLALAVCWPAIAGRAAGQSHEVKLNGHTFTLPAGFEIELVAGPPLVDRPIVADFDEQGRLYVADSSGSNEKVQVQLEKKPHRIVRLEDTDGDGKFDQSIVFADQMMFPEGCLWYAGSLYVAAPPSIWKLTDTDGDGKADQRVEWFQGKTLTGCANDLHGPYLGPDGWIYWAKGAFAKQTYERPGKPAFETRAAHIFRCRPDGSGIEPVMTGGMDNPVDVVFTPGGERIFTTTFLQRPGGGKRDGLIHAAYGGIYGKDHDPIYEPAHKWTSPHLMPVLAHMGAAAPCGLHRYESAVFGKDYQDNLFACQFNLHKVSRHVLVLDGATFQSRDEDFVVSSNLDFHPTDVLEDADGSLLVIDTGGWYKLCCPTSQLHKPDVLGAIYRVRKKDVPRVDDPRGKQLDWAKMTAGQLADLLDDPRPAVRGRAVRSLPSRGATAVDWLTEILKAGDGGRCAEARRNAVWAATRIDAPLARAAVRVALADSDETVRQAASHSLGVWRDRDAAPALLELLKRPSRANRRAAAEALGRIGDKAAVPALLEALGEPADRFLEHSLIYALIEIADRERTAAGLKRDNPNVRRAALVALEQMDGGKLEAAAVARELASTDPRLKESAWWIATRHPEWSGALASILRDRLAAKDLSAAGRDELVRQLAQFARATATQQLLAEHLRDAATAREARQTVLRAMAQAGLREAPEAWIVGLTEVLAADDPELVREAVAAARYLRPPKQASEKLAASLSKLGRDDKVPASVRLSALAALPAGLTKVEPELFAFLRSRLSPDQPVADRAAAVDVLSRANLGSDQLLALAESLKSVGPMELDRLLEAFAAWKEEAVGKAVIAALKASPARSSLRPDGVKQRLAKYPAAVQKEIEELCAALNADAAKQQAKLEELVGSLKSGDVRRGQAVFHSQKAACASCHAIGYLGGQLGPDLTRIGQIRSERDLLEAIVFPSASFVRSYESVQVVTHNGKVYNGLVRREAPDEIVLATGANEEARIPRSDIAEMEPSKVSIMPAGLDQQLTVQELVDLVAFLRACK